MKFFHGEKRTLCNRKKGTCQNLGGPGPPLAPPVPTPLRASLTFDQLKEVLMDVEVQLNNRPLGYMEDDIGAPHDFYVTRV